MADEALDAELQERKSAYSSKFRKSKLPFKLCHLVDL